MAPIYVLKTNSKMQVTIVLPLPSYCYLGTLNTTLLTSHASLRPVIIFGKVILKEINYIGPKEQGYSVRN